MFTFLFFTLCFFVLVSACLYVFMCLVNVFMCVGMFVVSSPSLSLSLLSLSNSNSLELELSVHVQYDGRFGERASK
jgi:hypothetical protein